MGNGLTTKSDSVDIDRVIGIQLILIMKNLPPGQSDFGSGVEHWTKSAINAQEI